MYIYIYRITIGPLLKHLLYRMQDPYSNLNSVGSWPSRTGEEGVGEVPDMPPTVEGGLHSSRGIGPDPQVGPYVLFRGHMRRVALLKGYIWTI